jgi:histidyl-tRNA synthetase
LGHPFDSVIAPNSKIQKLTEKLNSRGIKNIVFEPLLARGFDYYTGVVFEIFDTNPVNRRAVFGGGRYDNLLEIFGGQKVPTVGFGMGDVVIREILETRNLLPKGVSGAHLYIANIDSDSFDFSAQLANDLRAEGLDVVVDYTNKKLGDQIKIADKKRIPFVLFVGPDEVKSGKFVVKNLKMQEEVTLSKKEVTEFVRNEIRG